MKPMPRVFFSLVLLCGWLIAGCASDPRQGYTHEALWSENVTTVHVPIFENRTFDRDIQFELTDALVKELESRTPYKVTTLTRADTMLTGRIADVERRQLSRSRATGLGEEMVVSITIDFEWKDLRTGSVIVARESFTGQGLFNPSPPGSEPIELGQISAVQTLAREIVSQMRSPW